MSDTHIGAYRILERLGKGGMAEVFLAERGGPHQFMKRVAVKALLPDMGAQSAVVQMFLDEARLVARLSHPNIAQMFELGEADGRHFVVMEYVNGKNLNEVLKACTRTGRPLPALLAARIVSHTSQALHYAHEFCDENGAHLGIIHRDVSPQNIMLTYDGAVKVVDFGIAKATTNVGKTQVGMIKGKIAYLSPEQILQEALLDRRSDIFSLGAVLYQLLSGHRPFTGDTDLETMHAIVREPPPELRLVEPQKTRPLADIALKALAKDRGQRYQTAREMHLAIENYLLEQHAVIDSQVIANFLRDILAPAPPPAADQTDRDPIVGSEALDETTLRPRTPSREQATVPGSKPRNEAPLPAATADAGVSVTVPNPELASGDAAISVTVPTPQLEAEQAELSMPVPRPRARAADAASAPTVPRPELGLFADMPEGPLLGTAPGALADSAGEPAPRTRLSSFLWAVFILGVATAIGFGLVQLRSVPTPSVTPKRPVSPVAPKPETPSAAGADTASAPTPDGSDSAHDVAASNGPAGLLVVRTDPVTEMWVDGRPLPPAGLELKPGGHAVRLVNTELGIRLRQRVQVRPGQTTRVERKIERGALAVFVSPYGEVIVDGKSFGVTPLDAPIALYEGEHSLRVVCEPSRREHVQSVQIRAGATSTVRLDLR